ncbi:MAG: DUF1848 domain-containing protein [Candidatus Methanoplasma sp.]|jgi:DNA repair photolyase|nr:DUF1848 domain-containing protein [Candidatus Methanoplasma sp.]
MIICASRRTDVPAFHSEWMMNRLRAGYALVRNPVHRTTVHRVDLTPANVDCMIFMTKDPRPMMPFLDELDEMRLRYLFHVTVTPYGKDIEPGVPSKADVADAFRSLSERIGRKNVVWRYDPVMFNDKITPEYHGRKFETLCSELAEHTDRCAFSFLDMYGKLSGFSDRGLLRASLRSEKEAFGEAVGETARRHGVALTHCCPDVDLSKYGIQKRGCIDRETMLSLGIPFDDRPAAIRDGCMCIRNIDVGCYDTCMHDCIYCYANSKTKDRKREVYDPAGELLCGTVGDKDSVTCLRSRTVMRLSDV